MKINQPCYKILFYSLFIIFSFSLNAEENTNNSSQAGESGGGAVGGPRLPNSGGGGGAIKDDSTQMMLQSIITSGLNAAEGAGYFSKYGACMSGCSTGCAAECGHLAVKGTLNFGQAALTIMAAKQARNTRDSVDPFNGIDLGSTGTSGINFPDLSARDRENLINMGFNPDDFNANSMLTPSGIANMSLPPGVDKALSALEKAGFTLDKESGVVTTPDGAQLSAADFSSPAAMAAAGMTPDQISGLQNAMAAFDEQAGPFAQQAASVLAMGVDAGGGGGAGGYGGGGPNFDDFDGDGADPSSSLSAYLKKLQMQGQKPGDKNRMVAGKSVKFGNELIGIKEDNLFEIQHRRYNLLDKQNNFIKK